MARDQADHYLVEQIRTGQPQAWRLLIERYQGRLLAYAKTRIASIPDAEDTVQETFIGFLQSLNRYDIARSLETFLFTILRYKITDYLRARSSGSRGLMTQADDWWEASTAAVGESPSGYAMRQESVQSQEKILADVLRKLVQDFRERQAFEDLQVIELLFFAGRRNSSVADLLEVDEKHVAGVKFRAIQRVQKFLAEMEESQLAAMSDLQADATVCKIWREHRITCLKRGTLGQYLLGVLEDPWLSYTQFHLDVIGCPLCLANLEDLRTEESRTVSPESSQRIFASSIGFLSRASQP